MIGLGVGVFQIVLPLWNSFCLLVFLNGCLCLFVHYSEPFVFSCFSLINNILLLTYQKKKKFPYWFPWLTHWAVLCCLGSDCFCLSSGSHVGWAFYYFSAGSRIQRIFQIWIFYGTFKFPRTDTNATTCRYLNTLLHFSFRLVQIVPSFWCFFSMNEVIYILFTCLHFTFFTNPFCVGILYLIQRETHSRLLASLFKILMLLVSSTPYESSS